MKKLIILGIAFMMMLVAPAAAVAQSQMSDKQVLEYIKKGLKSGKSQAELGGELTLRGVDRAQIERVKKLYEEQGGKMSELEGSENGSVGLDRSHSFQESDDASVGTDGEELEETVKFPVPVVMWKSANYMDPASRWNPSEEGGEKIDTLEVYGRDIFMGRKLNFNPSENVPTPKDYVLGAGDEVIVDVFGANQNTMNLQVTPDGYIFVEDLGPIYIAGKTIAAANTYLKNKLSSIYGGLAGRDEISDIQLSLGQIRSVQVTVVGDVNQPGTYMVPSVATAFHVLFKSGGIKEPGTVRNIKVMRNNKVAANVDVYDLLVNGSRKGEISLEEGDVVLVGAYETLVRVGGEVKRPMLFELKEKETIADVIKYAGGFSMSAYTDAVSVTRRNGAKFEVFNVESSQFASFVLKNGDEVRARSISARFENRVMVSGAVRVPGLYEVSSSINSVRKLVNKAGGLMEDAFSERAVIRRRRADKTLETLSVDLAGVMSGTKADVALQNNDELYVYSVYEIQERGTLAIEGEVASPGVFPFAENTTVQDLILLAGGLLRSSSVVRVDVARLIENSESTRTQNEIATYHTFSMQNGYAVDGADKFVLEPNDVVMVRRSPTYVSARMVKISGEVNFPGPYALSRREERVSDLVKKAGDLTDFAYIKGARITRVVTEEERAQHLTAQSAGGSSSFADSVYTVSFDMVDALKNPGGVNDLILRDGDILNIPVYSNTIGVSGAVQVPTTVAFQKGIKKKALVNAAGGYKKGARKHKAYIIYMNGRVSKLKNNTTIEPGSQVFVPMKDMNAAQVERYITISNSMMSLGMMGITIANLLK